LIERKASLFSSAKHLSSDFYLSGTNATTFELVIFTDDERDSFRVSLMFFDKDAPSEGFRRVVVQNRDDALDDDWAAIQSFVNEVDCAASPFDAVLDGLSLRV
jgi:hypothetical protein